MTEIRDLGEKILMMVCPWFFLTLGFLGVVLIVIVIFKILQEK